MMEWAEWDDRDETKPFVDGGRVVAYDELPGGVVVSTVFLGLDHNYFGTGGPILFETMTFGGPHDGFQERYRTWNEAVGGHDRALSMAKGAEAS